MNKWIWALLLLAVTLAGCDLFSRDFYLQESDFPDKNLGALMLLLDGNSIANKTIAPADMTVARYDLTFTHTTAANNFTVADWAAGSSYSKNGLAPGSWTVAVAAEDSTGVRIGGIGGVLTNTTPFTITAGQITGPVAVNVIPLIGTGNVTLTLTWPIGTVNSPVTIASFLAPAGSTTPEEPANAITFVINEPSRSASCILTGETASYHTLLLRLSGAGTLAWGWVDSVRIVTGKDYTGAMALTSGTGGLTLNLTSDMQNPITINWSTVLPAALPPAGITAGTNFTVAAVPTPGTPATGYTYYYQWYQNGSSLGSSFQAASITYGSTLLPGDYGLCVVVTEKQTAGSGIRTISSKGFNVNVH